MSKILIAMLIGVLTGCLLAVVPAAWAETDEGSAAACPWSGYWWQHKTGGLTGPLGKYDHVFQTQAAQWERTHHAAASAQDWFGHCHAWAASSVCEKEPRQSRQVSQTGFGVGDQKGLLAACHAQDIANTYGDRFGDGAGSEDRNDIAPDELWRLLQTYIKQRKLPLILDLEAGEAVWNYPIYQYRVEYQKGQDGWYDAILHLIAADSNVGPDYVGTQPTLFSYNFRFKMQDGAVADGSGQWTGFSVQDHPDFAWYPYVAMAENPEVHAANVAKVVGHAVGGSGDVTPADGPPADDNPPADGGTPPILVNEILSADDLIAAIMNKKSSFAFDVFVDKGDGGRYKSGEPIRVSFRSAQAGYLYLFDVDPLGEVTLVFPLMGQPNYIQKDQLYDLPGRDVRSWFVARGQGQHDVKAILTTRPLKITGFANLPQHIEPVAAPAGGQQTAGQTAPQQTAPQQTAQTPQAQAGPQSMWISPSLQQRIKRRLYSFFRKGEGAEPEAPKKLGPFAQDVCSYFVLATAGRSRPGQQQP